MAIDAGNAKRKKSKGAGKVLPALCNLLGTLILLAVIGVCAPLTVPMLMGYEVLNVVSGSMEPAVPVGSVVYAKAIPLEEVQEGQVIVYQDGESIVVTRVVTNHISLGEFETKGDADNVEDPSPIPYEAVIGRMEAHVPMFGAFVPIYASLVGKVYLLMAAACGVMFNVLASRMREARRQEAARDQFEATKAGTTSLRPRRSIGGVLRAALAVVLAVAFIGSAGVIGFTTWQYSMSDALYNDAIKKYEGLGSQSSGNLESLEMAPITIDFKELCAANPDVVGWIYCPNTVINYPVLQGENNDRYLSTDYRGDYNMNGSIFVDADNSRGFVDSNSIIYGHHMNSGSMFAGLVQWADQKYYEDHPVMWLLTPTQDYKVELFSGHHVIASSYMYDIISTPGKKLSKFLAEARDLSDFSTQESIVLDDQSHYVMLTTCAYLFDNDRYVLHGKLVPIGSAGGAAIWRP